MKAISLPIETLVIVVIVVIVLIAVIALFFNVWSPSSAGTSLQAATNAACMRVNPTFCNVQSDAAMPSSRTHAARTPVYDFDADGDGNYGVDATGTPVDSDDTLLALCQTYYNINIDSECRTQVCHCD